MPRHGVGLHFCGAAEARPPGRDRRRAAIVASSRATRKILPEASLGDRRPQDTRNVITRMSRVLPIGLGAALAFAGVSHPPLVLWAQAGPNSSLSQSITSGAQTERGTS